MGSLRPSWGIAGGEVNDGAAQLIHASFEHTGVGVLPFQTPWPGCGRAGVMRLVARELVFNDPARSILLDFIPGEVAEIAGNAAGARLRRGE